LPRRPPGAARAPAPCWGPSRASVLVWGWGLICRISPTNLVTLHVFVGENRGRIPVPAPQCILSWPNCQLGQTLLLVRIGRCTCAATQYGIHFNTRGLRTRSTAPRTQLLLHRTYLVFVLRYWRQQGTQQKMHWQEEVFNPRRVFLLKHVPSRSSTWAMPSSV
jgi:hypothetical protein